MSPKVGVFVQARMGSTRLPGKVMMDLGGQPVLRRVLDRVSQIAGIDRVVLVTYRDYQLGELAQSWGHQYVVTNSVRYSEDDVLSRYFEAYRSFNEDLDLIVRITADCPMLDPEVSSRVLARAIEGDYDYYSNVHPPTYPDGLDTEVFIVDALCRAWAHAKGKEREHVTPYIWRRPYKFHMGNMAYAQNLKEHRWTLDTIEDLNFIRRVYDDLGPDFRMADVLALPYTHTLTRTIKL